MALPLEPWSSSTFRTGVNRRLIIAAVLLAAVLVAWQLSSQNLVVVAAATAPVGTIGLLLARDRAARPPAALGGSLALSREAFRRELDRSRRHERPLALAAAWLGDGAVTGDALAETIALARGQMRSIDLLWYDGSRIWLLMPESRREGATTCIRRINGVATAARSAVWRLVVFPDDAMTAGALIAELHRTAPLDLEGRHVAS
jgi:hypothetical protein